MISPAEYDFLAPPAIHFGWGRFAEVAAIAAPLGRRAFLVSGSRTLQRNGTLDTLRGHLQQAEINVIDVASVSGEPTIEDADAATGAVRQHDPGAGDFVIGLGGGSAIDLAKAVAAMATNREGETIRDYLEGIGRGLQIVEAPLPVLAIPTTAGTGSEATKNAVISCDDPAVKKSLRSDQMVPRAVLIDPQLAVTVPATTTAHTGMDAITQLLESAISRRARPIPRALCRQGLSLALPAIVEAVENGQSRPAREDMAHAALLSGMALANSGLGMAHGVAAALGVHCDIPHGLACAIMLPTALRVNREASLSVLDDIARMFRQLDASTPEARVDRLIDWIAEIGQRIGIPGRLSEVGVRAEQLPALVGSSRGNSMSGNPVELSDERLHGLLSDLL